MIPECPSNESWSSQIGKTTIRNDDSNVFVLAQLDVRGVLNSFNFCSLNSFNQVANLEMNGIEWNCMELIEIERN